MNIAVFIKSTTFHKNYGGLETQNRVLCEGLAQKGHKITVISPKRGIELNEAEENGIRYVFIQSSYKYFLAGLNPESWERKSVELFQKIHKQTPFDLVISQSTAGIGIIKNKKDLGVKTLSIAHGTTVGELKTHFQNIKNIKDIYWAVRNLQYSLRQYFGRQRQYILLSDKVVAVSNAVKKQIIDETFAPDGLIEVVPNGVERNKIKYIEKSGSNGLVRLVFTSRVIKSKGIFDLLDVMEKLKNENVILDVIGDGEDRAEFLEKSEQMGLGGKINFIGKVPYTELLDKLSGEDIFVMPTHRFEGFPMTVVEAMLAGLPSVVYDLGGTSDAIVDGETGYLVPEGDVSGFISKVALLVKDTSLRHKMGLASRQRALAEFTVEKMINRYEQLIERVLK